MGNQAMNWLPPHKASLHLTHNEHRNYYQSAAAWIEEQETFGGGPTFDWVSPEEREKAIRDDSVWVLHWYPETPVGFCCLAASSLEALQAAVFPSESE